MAAISFSHGAFLAYWFLLLSLKLSILLPLSMFTLTVDVFKMPKQILLINRDTFGGWVACNHMSVLCLRVKDNIKMEI